MTNNEEMITIQGKCTMCNSDIEIEARAADVENWQNGKLIQNAMPYLDVYAREGLISHTCRECLVKMYGQLN